MSQMVTLQSPEDVLRSLVAALEGRVLVVGPSARLLRDLIGILSERESATAEYQFLADADVLSDLRDDFLSGARAADLVKEETLTLWMTTGVDGHPLVITDGTVHVLAEVGEALGTPRIEDPALVEHATQYYRNILAESNAFELRTPPMSTIIETLAERVDEAVQADFVEGLDALESVDYPVDIVRFLLLLAAKNGVLQYDISRWGEDIELASTASFSRTKSELEEEGLISTEKVPQDIGRPRYRLRPGSELEDPSIRSLIQVAASPA